MNWHRIIEAIATGGVSLMAPKARPPAVGERRVSRPTGLPPMGKPMPRRRSMYEELRDKGAGYCNNCGAVVTPDDLVRNPVRPAPNHEEDHHG